MQHFLTTLKDDLKGILEVAKVSFKEFYSKEKLFERLKDKKYWVQVMKDENRRNKVVAFKIWYEDDDKEAYDWLDGVLPEYRRQGIATEMFRIQFNLARSLGYSKSKLKTHKGHPEMISLCRKLGFIETGRDPNHWKEGLEAIFLEYNLRRA